MCGLHENTDAQTNLM